YLYMELEQQAAHLALAEQNQILDFSASHDALTGYYNRAGVMKKAFSFIRESKDTDTFMAVMADLDHLKQINDTFGHDEGDSAIKEAADMLSGALNDRGIVGRTGGDEYVCFFKITEEGSEDAFISHIKEACRAYNAASGKPYYVEISIGCYPFGRSEGSDLLSVLKKADVKLYEAKKVRRASVVR
ncbi:MAG: GGDEF domain-containing protein, partial [Lachnospiraceae bacterium]|nr:GGDEF domain-containing protein [Lachnospiraceae bacterium]